MEKPENNKGSLDFDPTRRLILQVAAGGTAVVAAIAVIGAPAVAFAERLGLTEGSVGAEIESFRAKVKDLNRNFHQFAAVYGGIDFSAISFDELDRKLAEVVARFDQAVIDAGAFDEAVLMLEEKYAGHQLEGYVKASLLSIMDESLRETEADFEVIEKFFDRAVERYSQFFEEITDDNFVNRILQNPDVSLLLLADGTRESQMAAIELAKYAKNNPMQGRRVGRAVLQNTCEESQNPNIAGYLSHMGAFDGGYPTLLVIAGNKLKAKIKHRVRSEDIAKVMAKQ